MGGLQSADLVGLRQSEKEGDWTGLEAHKLLPRKQEHVHTAGVYHFYSGWGKLGKENIAYIWGQFANFLPVCFCC